MTRTTLAFVAKQKMEILPPAAVDRQEPRMTPAQMAQEKARLEDELAQIEGSIPNTIKSVQACDLVFRAAAQSAAQVEAISVSQSEASAPAKERGWVETRVMVRAKVMGTSGYLRFVSAIERLSASARVSTPGLEFFDETRGCSFSISMYSRKGLDKP